MGAPAPRPAARSCRPAAPRPRTSPQAPKRPERSGSPSLEGDPEREERRACDLQVRVREKRAREIHAERPALDAQAHTGPAQSVLHERVARAHAHEALISDVQAEPRL